MARLELSLRCQPRGCVVIFFFFPPRLDFKTSGGHHAAVDSLSQNKYVP